MLAAGLSTLDGILVAISSMVVRDLYLPFAKDKEEGQRSALSLSRYTLVVIGVISLLISLNPPELIGLFAQKGVYGLAAASFVPMLFGTILTKKLNAKLVFACAIVGLVAHLYLNIFGGVANPAVSATYSIFLSTGIFLTGLVVEKVLKPQKTSERPLQKDEKAYS